jgi:cytochrome c oxidase assembly factor 6
MTFTPPKRSERKICWANRDAYFKCLDASNIKDPSKDTTSECAKLKEIYQSTCPSVWVSLNCY